MQKSVHSIPESGVAHTQTDTDTHRHTHTHTHTGRLTWSGTGRSSEGLGGLELAPVGFSKKTEAEALLLAVADQIVPMCSTGITVGGLWCRL